MDFKEVNHKKSIILACPNLRHGGAEKNTVNLANELQNKGFGVSIVLLNKEGALLDQVNSDVEILSLNKSRSRYAFIAFAKVLRKKQSKFVISMLRESSLMVSISLFFSKVKPFFIIREACHYEYRLTPYKQLITFLYSKANLFVANSQSTLESFKANNILTNVPSKVIYNPTLSKNFFGNLDQNFQHQWLDDDEIITLITGGRLEKGKGVDQVILAFQLLSKRLENLRLVILGDGSQRNDLKKSVESSDLDDKVDFLGFVDNPSLYIRKANLFIMASENEGFGNLLVEAMACGTKVLARNSGGPKEILDNGKVGFLKEFNSPERLAFEIEQALSLPCDVKKLIARAKNYSVSRITEEYLSIFDKSLEFIE